MLFDVNLIMKTTSTNRIDNNELTAVYYFPASVFFSYFFSPLSCLSVCIFVWRCPRGFPRKTITNWGRQTCRFSIFRIKRSQVGNLFKDVNGSSCSEVAWRMIGKSSAMQGTHCFSLSSVWHLYVFSMMGNKTIRDWLLMCCFFFE